jgi:hypothetical protein
LKSADRLLSVDTPTRIERQYYHQDGMGSTTNLSAPSDATLHSYSLDAFGKDIAWTKPLSPDL